MKKRILSAVLSAALVLGLTGCGDSVSNKKVSDNQSIEQSQDNSQKTEDSNNKATNTESETAKSKESTVHFIDTGNSDAILIKGEKNVLIDGADNDDEKTLVDYIKKQGISELDYVISTHPDADHCGALDSVFDNIKVNNLLVGNSKKPTKTYEDFIKSAASKGINGSTPVEGAKFELGNNSYMQMFNVKGGSDANESSLVTLYVNDSDKFLFTGDAGEESEKEILKDMIDVDVLKVGHHGSKSSTTTEFLNKVNPEFAIITCGKDNSYGHPHKETMDKLQKVNNLGLHRTDQCGTVVFKSTGIGVSTDCKVANFDSGKKVTESSTKEDSNEKKDDNSTNNNVTDNKNNSTNNSANNNVNNNTDKNTNNDSTSNKPKPDTSKPQGKMVWLSATGDKYHSINNCGRMNPDKARQVSLEEAKKSYSKCSKC